MIISEAAGGFGWELKPTFDLCIDRTGKTVKEYLEEQGVIWKFNDNNECDIVLWKNYHPEHKDGNFISILAEPREAIPSDYIRANVKKTMTCSPGNDGFERFYFAAEWENPMLEDFNKRIDKFCWIGQPYENRVSMAREMINKGVQIDFYSSTQWPFDSWKGYADNEITISRKYKYRVIFEKTHSFGYHSEKLLNGIRSGCIPLYDCSPDIDLSYVNDSFIPFSIDNAINIKDLSKKVVDGIGDFMFSDRWEVYSFKNTYNKIINLSKKNLI